MTPRLSEIEASLKITHIHGDSRAPCWRELEALGQLREAVKIARALQSDLGEARAEADALRRALKDALDDQRIYRERWRKADEEATDWSKAAEAAEDYIETLDAGVIANYRSYIEARAHEKSGGNYCTCKMGCWGIQNWNPACPVHRSALAPRRGEGAKCEMSRYKTGTPPAGDGDTAKADETRSTNTRQTGDGKGAVAAAKSPPPDEGCPGYPWKLSDANFAVMAHCVTCALGWRVCKNIGGRHCPACPSRKGAA